MNGMDTVASADAKNGFAQLLDRVTRNPAPIVITRNTRPTAVILSVTEFERLRAAAPDPLATLRSKFDAMLANMQTAEARAGVDALFAATPAELGASAVKAAKKTKDR